MSSKSKPNIKPRTQVAYRAPKNPKMTQCLAPGRPYHEFLSPNPKRIKYCARCRRAMEKYPTRMNLPVVKTPDFFQGTLK